MTGSNFRPDVVARIIEMIRAGIDPHGLRRQVHREHQELTAQGIERVLDIARQEIVERCRGGRHGGDSGPQVETETAAPAAGAAKPAKRPGVPADGRPPGGRPIERLPRRK